jgi:hypothetical protein
MRNETCGIKKTDKSGAEVPMNVFSRTGYCRQMVLVEKVFHVKQIPGEFENH